ncbi:MAG: ABC transporter ATP-binding protein [Candidatus Aenigmarchaeota archaeon]|nr:ABC transporter ATP-binding protein [Candidatus Aenigmarchaeota archaeon]
MKLLELISIRYRVEDKVILDKINLSVRNSEIFSILGVNGAGKTTLANVIMGLVDLKNLEGKIIFNGEDITKLETTERAKLGITLAWQRPAKFEGITVREYLGINYQRSSEECLKLVGLNPKDYLNRFVDDNLSGGERKRIELASVFSINPKLVILDEPDSGIDMASIHVIKKVLSKFREFGTSVLLITHNEEMAKISDRAAIICSGKIVKIGPSERITKFFKEHCKSCGHVGKVDEAEIDE